MGIMYAIEVVILTYSEFNNIPKSTFEIHFAAIVFILFFAKKLLHLCKF